MPNSNFPDSAGSILPPPPMLPDGRGGRAALVAALGFVDDPPLSPEALAAWFEAHLIEPGRMSRPMYVSEAFYGRVMLDPPPPSSSTGMVPVAPPDEVAQLVVVARARVLHALRAFMPPARDERFLMVAMASGRVRAEPGSKVWEAFPEETDLLSDIVLSLFAADILTHREFHEQHLCVCKTCFRIDFDPRETGYTGCRDHRSSGSSMSMPPPRAPI